MLALLNDKPILVLMATVALGAAVGTIPLGKIRLGASGALFVGLLVGAVLPDVGDRLALFQSFGLALFAYLIGLGAGKVFFRDLRRNLPLMLAAVVVVILTAFTVHPLAALLNLDLPTAIGVWTGSLTATPAMALLFAGPSRSVPVQRLVESGWLLHLGPSRATQRELGPRVVSTADAWETARDPFAQRARLPQAAWAAARAALLGPRPGPVLVQVARAGFIPALVCERCRTPARCRVCAGPLGFRDARAARHGEVACRWCGTRERGFRCTEC